MERVAIVGSPGSGKSTLADRLARSARLRHIELDALWHRPGWTTVSVPDFRLAVAEALTAERWVVDGNYRMVSDLVHGAADTIVFLDLSRWRVTARVVHRSVLRLIRRETLWGTNRESLRRLISRDPEHSIIAWTWVYHPRYRALYGAVAHDGSWDHAVVWHLRTPAHVRHFEKVMSDAATSPTSASRVA